MATTTDVLPPAGRQEKDRTHYLYVAVIVAVALGIAVGLLFPDFAKQLKPLGTGFVSLIKMMIAPVIFCTIVLGIGSVRKASQVGKVGGIALVYFLTMSTLALGIGLVVGNIIHPGEGLHITPDVAEKAASAATAEDDDRRLPAAHDSHHPVLGADHRGRAADPAGRPAGGLRPAGNGQER